MKSEVMYGVLHMISVAVFADATPNTGKFQAPYKRATKRNVPSILNHLAKRDTPTIGEGIDTNDPLRGGKLIAPEGSTNGAFMNAFQLMDYAINLPDDSTNPIFLKYFRPEDKQNVTNIFDRLLGPSGSGGAAALANIRLTGGDLSDEDEPAPAVLEDYFLESPNLILDEDAFVYPNRDDAQGCDAWEEGMTQEMYLLGSILLHEYVHWDWFLGSIHGGDIDDQKKGYGWEACRALDKNLALYNADSYAWFATENLWATLCNVPGGYDAPGVERRK